MATPAQIEQALTYSALFKIFQDTTPENGISVTDQTDWISIGISPINVSRICKIVDPASVTIYENIGFSSGSFGSPDSDTLSDKVLNTATGGKPVSGTYALYVKIKVVALNVPPVYAQKVFYFNLANKSVCLNPKIEILFDCAAATAVAKDNTNYQISGGFSIVSTSRTITIYPPETSGQSPVTGTGQSVSISNLLAPATYEADFVTDMVYETANSLTQIQARYSAKTEAKSQCDDILCKLFCCLSKIESKYSELKNNPTMQKQQWEILLKGTVYYELAKAARMCGNEAKVQQYCDLFYKYTGCDPKCDCCEDTMAPVIPCGCECHDGTDGKEVEMDSVENEDGSVTLKWRYVGDAGWNDLATISPVAGADGANGVSILSNQFPSLATLSTNFESLLVGRTPYVLAANTLANDGDEIQIFAQATSSNPKSQNLKIVFGPTDLMGAFDYPTFYASNISLIKIFVRLTRINNTTVNYYSEIRYYNGLTNPSKTRLLVAESEIDSTQITSLDLSANSYNIDFQAKSIAIGDVTSKYFEIINLKKIIA